MKAGTFRRVNKRAPCPICGKADWCMVSTDGTAAICARIASDHRVGDKGAGWLHRLGSTWRPAIPAPATELPAASQPELANMAARWATAISPERMERLSLDLGLSVPSLRALRVGWSIEHGAFTFPMHARGRVLGIRLRLPSGRKFSVRGGHEGLFMPFATPANGPLIIAEGPTDTAALLDLGFPAVIGRPNCSGGSDLVLQYLATCPTRRDVVLCANRDEAKTGPDGRVFHPGQDGARRLADEILSRRLARSLKIAYPPGTKDWRDWMNKGATGEDARAVIAARSYERTLT